MYYFTELTITSTSPSSSEQDYFNSVIKNQSSSSSVHDDDNFENDPPITISNKHYPPNIYHHPLSKHLFTDQKVHSATILLKQQQRLAPPPSTLQKNVNSSPTITKHIHIDAEEEKRRPSVITFANNNSDSHSVFYDAFSTISNKEEDETQAQTTITKKQQESPTINNTKRNSKDWRRRPSNISRISTAYTNKTAAIPIDHIDLEQSHYLREGIVLCAVVPTWQIKIELKQKHYQQVEVKKRPLKWKEYRAVITQSGYLELYRTCHCKNNMLRSCFHLHYKKPKHVIDLHPSVNNQLFQKAFLINHNSSSNMNETNIYHLSLMSPIDFSWCLSSTNNSIFYFQSNSVNVSQHWYRSLYTALPNVSKKPLPPVCDLMVPELNICIRITISDLIHGEDENVELKKVRESALVLLHRNGTRPSHWNKKTVGLCWKLYNNNNNNDQLLDWVLKPTDDDDGTTTAYLIEPRLIEKTHELQLRYYEHEKLLGATQQEEKKPPPPPPSMKGYLIDTSSKKNTFLYCVTMDQYLFLYENNNKLQQQPLVQQSSSWCYSRKRRRIRRNHQTFLTTTSTPPLADLSSSIPPRSTLVGVIDLLKIKEIKEESCDYNNNSSKKDEASAEEPQKLLLHLDNYLFQIMHHQPMTINDWSTRLDSIRNYYGDDKKTRQNEIMQSAVMYVKKSTKSQYNTFERRLCILTNNGDLFIFKKPSSNKKMNNYDVLQYSLSLLNDDGLLYIYSGEELCSYITGLPIQWSSRIFDDTTVVDADNNQPKQCCFVIHYKNNKEYIFLTRFQDQKDAWVQSICCNFSNIHCA